MDTEENSAFEEEFEEEHVLPEVRKSFEEAKKMLIEKERSNKKVKINLPPKTWYFTFFNLNSKKSIEKNINSKRDLILYLNKFTKNYFYVDNANYVNVHDFISKESEYDNVNIYSKKSFELMIIYFADKKDYLKFLLSF